MKSPSSARLGRAANHAYVGWVRQSLYFTVRDGTRLAADIYRPCRQEGEPTSELLPVLWAHDRYRRAYTCDGGLRTLLDRSSWLRAVILSGYVVGVVDVRGGGASQGKSSGPFGHDETADAYDITEWFAAQPWSSGAVGMFGRSYLGISQYTAASTAPPHLKAIFPEMALFDLYSFVYPGGVFRSDYQEWVRRVREMDRDPGVAPVEGDADRALLHQAQREHQGNVDPFALFARLPCRDSKDDSTGAMPHLTHSPSTYLPRYRDSSVAVYHLAGWFDMWPRDALLWYHNLGNPQKIVLGPWSHDQEHGIDLAEEHLRWYDYWLKGIENGVRDEPPIRYFVIGAPPGQQWRSAWRWPVRGTQMESYYFHDGQSGSVDSVNDGSLGRTLPASDPAADCYRVDYSTTTGRANRWTNGYGGPFGYPDMTGNDRKGLTYTTAPLPSNLEVTGHPVVYLWVSCSARDSDFFVYLEEVDRTGFSKYVTEGTLRASHRALAEPPWPYLGLPYHRCFKEDLADLPDGPAELVFDLHPTSRLFPAGSRIRVTLTCADRDNLLTPELPGPPEVRVHRDAAHPSRIVLPIVPSSRPIGEGVSPC